MHSGDRRGHDDCPREPQALEGQWARARQAQPCGRGHGKLRSGNPERKLGLLMVYPTGGTLLGVGGYPSEGLVTRAEKLREVLGETQGLE